DIVNMGIAKLVDAPVILVGDIDRGGVFAQLLGTLMLLEEDERARVKGLVINKFRGDKTILDPGIVELSEKGNVDVVGVVPYMSLNLDDEDSLTERFDEKRITQNRFDKSVKVYKNDSDLSLINNEIDGGFKIDIAVIRLPHISNFTDFNVFEQTDIINLCYVNDVNSLGNPDMIILPGSKNTIGDMRWLRESGFEAKIKKLASEEKEYLDLAGIDGNKEYEKRSYSSTPVFGICGGYQMLGNMIYDEEGHEEGGCIEGMGFLPIDTHICKEKTRKQISGRIGNLTGLFEALSGKEFEGYEIHMGVSESADNKDNKDNADSSVVQKGNVYGTYVHGIFDKGDIAETIIKALAERKNVNLVNIDIKSYKDIKEAEYDKLADTLREFMDMDKVYEIME
ncbi:MAG: AAA family ATPase, partial [Lachnospiraceae bacterium]|nr:AAA family ATPase [Lachnospiraceae bacterium]